jgi:hypothetical protein
MRRRFALIGCGSFAIAASRFARAGDALIRILVVGDSQAQGLAGGLQRRCRVDRSCRVIDRSRISTGLGSAAHFNWPAEAAGIAEAERGAIAVVMFGANDRPPPRTKGDADPAFVNAYGSHIHVFLQGLKQWCSAVIWVGHPIVREPAYAEDMALLNRIFAAQAIASGAVWFPSWPLFIDADGNYDAYGRGVDGLTTRLRADDGIHLTSAGYDQLARALLPVIELYWPVSPHS